MIATSELVVPRSIPTARVRHACLLRDSPGSASWKSASAMIRDGTSEGPVPPFAAGLVDEPLEVAQRYQRARRVLETAGTGVQRVADCLQRLARAGAHLLGHERDLDHVARALRRAELVVQLEDLEQKRRRRRDLVRALALVAARRLLLGDVDPR